MYRNILLISVLILVLPVLFSCKTNKQKADILITEALIKTDNSDFKGAIKDLDKAISCDSLNPKSWLMRANLKVSLKQFNESISDYDKCIALNDKNMEAFYNRGYAYFLLGNQEKACENYFIAFKLGKPNIEDKIKNCKEIQ